VQNIQHVVAKAMIVFLDPFRPLEVVAELVKGHNLLVLMLE
jgi:hypothetical protein